MTTGAARRNPLGERFLALLSPEDWLSEWVVSLQPVTAPSDAE
jgi:hypothetical protein